MEDKTTITFEDREGNTGAALVDALYARIDENARKVRNSVRLIERIVERNGGVEVQECEDEDCYDCTRDVLDIEEAENDVVGFTLDSFRLARVIEALS